MDIIEDLGLRYPVLEGCERDMRAAFDALVSSFDSGGRLYICGNGGSAADALHITGELVKSFVIKRPLDECFAGRVSGSVLLDNLQGALPVFTLVENVSLATAFANDCDARFCFAQQVYAYAREGDCVLGISTSGNSENILYALKAAKGRGAVTLGLTGSGGGKMKELCDVCICAPGTEVYKIQELHLPLYHTLCRALEEHYWGC